jgi:flagellar capping protein FliD
MSGRSGKQAAGGRKANETEAEKQRRKADEQASESERQKEARASRQRSSGDDGLIDASASGWKRPRGTAPRSPESSPAQKPKNAAGKRRSTAVQSSEDDEMTTSGASEAAGQNKLKKVVGMQVKLSKINCSKFLIWSPIMVDISFDFFL